MMFKLKLLLLLFAAILIFPLWAAQAQINGDNLLHLSLITQTIQPVKQPVEQVQPLTNQAESEDNYWFWLRPLCLALKHLLNWIYFLLGNWGLAIIFLAILLRFLTYPVTRYGLRQQKLFKQQQAKLKPFIDEINKQYQDGDKRYVETMKLYKQHNFSPFSSFKGCLWLVVQLPIFIALYQILSQSMAIKGVKFLWINDLSTPENLFPLGLDLPIIGSHFNLLPFFMLAAQLIQSYMMNQSGTPKKGKGGAGSKAIYIMPLVMVLLFYAFPSGLLIYWTTVNTCQIFEQWLIQRKRKTA